MVHRTRWGLVAILAVLTSILASSGGTFSLAASRSAHPPVSHARSGSLVFLSDQFTPITEASVMRTKVLSSFHGAVQFIPTDPGPLYDTVQAQAKAGKMSVSVVAGLHGDFALLASQGLLQNVSPLLQRLERTRTFSKALVDATGFGQKGASYYIPWVQATYIMAANKKALPYLPKGATLATLTYTQLEQWGANIQHATGQALVGFPAGPLGLMHRFFQGYLYPSYTHSTGVTAFRSPQAVQMWTQFKQLWTVVNPQSTSYGSMDEPLLSGEVWAAWDHTARLITAVQKSPNDFVLFPAPIGPMGRGFMPVVAGLAIPKGAPNQQGAQQLIDYLTQPTQQGLILKQLAFFPGLSNVTVSNLPAPIRLEASAVQVQTASHDAVPSLLPVGLGAQNGEFNKVFLDTFKRIVLNNEPIQGVLNDEGKTLQGVINAAHAPCWSPDPVSTGPCHVK